MAAARRQAHRQRLQNLIFGRGSHGQSRWSWRVGNIDHTCEIRAQRGLHEHIGSVQRGIGAGMC